MVRTFTPDWLADQPQALAMLPRGYTQPAARAHAVATAAKRQVHPGVLAAIARTSQTLPPRPARDAALAQLSQAGTVAVVTGQQLGLFLGPLYTLYKAVSAIVNARQLTAETGVAAVAVFWLQNEDHDAAEIDHTYAPGAGEARRFSVQLPGTGRESISELELPAETDSVLALLHQHLQGLPDAEVVHAWLSRSWQSHRDLTEAFTSSLDALLGDSGLLFLDPRAPELAEAAGDFHKRCLDFAEPLAMVLQERATALAEQGWDVPVHIRPAAPLFFYAPDGEQGPRFRLQAQGDAYALVGDAAQRTIQAHALRQALDVHPRAFSTSVLSRPLWQDTLLPCVAYVGGPGEIAYFSQLAPAYALLGLPMPLLVPRSRWLITDAPTQTALQQAGVSLADLAAGPARWTASLAGLAGSQQQTMDALQARLTEPFVHELSLLEGEMAAADPGLTKAVKQTQAAVAESVARLLGKWQRVLASQQSAELAKRMRWRTILTPDGAPQERVHGLPWFAARYGLQHVVASVLEQTVPFSGEIKELFL